MNDTLAVTPHQAARPATPGLAEVLRQLRTKPLRGFAVAVPRGIIGAWRERIRFRWDLEQMSKANPHLIDDIGLTRRQFEAEIVKPFWQR